MIDYSGQYACPDREMHVGWVADDGVVRRVQGFTDDRVTGLWVPELDRAVASSRFYSQKILAVEEARVGLLGIIAEAREKLTKLDAQVLEGVGS